MAISKQNSKFTLVLAIVIMIAWSVSFVVDIIVKSYEPPITIHALMMMVAGAAFGDAVVKRIS